MKILMKAVCCALLMLPVLADAWAPGTDQA
jgi:hypothetical protein